jgi:hypothetical protein
MGEQQLSSGFADIPAQLVRLGLSATSQQYFSLRTNQPPATSQQYFSLRTNQHQPSTTSQTNRLHLDVTWTPPPLSLKSCGELINPFLPLSRIQADN